MIQRLQVNKQRHHHRPQLNNQDNGSKKDLASIHGDLRDISFLREVFLT